MPPDTAVIEPSNVDAEESVLGGLLLATDYALIETILFMCRLASMHPRTLIWAFPRPTRRTASFASTSPFLRDRMALIWTWECSI